MTDPRRTNPYPRAATGRAARLPHGAALRPQTPAGERLP